MSTVGVARHDEDIHDIIGKPKEPIVKSPRYKSKRIFSQQKIKTTGHDTFGYAHYPIDPPSDYLKKGTRSIRRPEPIGKCSRGFTFFFSSEKTIRKPWKPRCVVIVLDKEEFRCTLETNRPPVPKWKFECPKGVRKDFIRENIKWADSLRPTEHRPRRVDSPRGNVQDLRNFYFFLLRRFPFWETQVFARSVRNRSRSPVGNDQNKRTRRVRPSS